MGYGDDRRTTKFDLDRVISQEGLQSPGNVYPQNIPAPRKTGKVMEGAPKPLSLPAIVESGGIGPALKACNPWDLYNVVFQCELAGRVFISEKRCPGSKVVAIRTSTKTNGEDLLQKYKRFHHMNILSSSECFKYNQRFHFLVDDLPITLEHLVACDAYPTEEQLASILNQILSGISYLFSKGYHHPALKCSIILMGLDGVVKIANLEAIRALAEGDSQSQSVRNLGFLAMELMQKYVKENVGIDDTARWPVESKAFDFLSFTTSARSIKELSQHPLMSCSSGGCLVSLARLAIISACTFYSLKPNLP